MSSSPAKPRPPYSSVFLHSRREAVVIFVLWMTGLFWAVPYCYYNGFLGQIENFDPDQVDTVLGIPTWLFWGIAVPWIVADVFTTWFCFFYMKDDDLGEGDEGASTPGGLGDHELPDAQDAIETRKEGDV